MECDVPIYRRYGVTRTKNVGGVMEERNVFALCLAKSIPAFSVTSYRHTDSFGTQKKNSETSSIPRKRTGVGSRSCQLFFCEERGRDQPHRRLVLMKRTHPKTQACTRRSAGSVSDINVNNDDSHGTTIGQFWHHEQTRAPHRWSFTVHGTSTGLRPVGEGGGDANSSRPTQ